MLSLHKGSPAGYWLYCPVLKILSLVYDYILHCSSRKHSFWRCYLHSQKGLLIKQIVRLSNIRHCFFFIRIVRAPLELDNLLYNCTVLCPSVHKALESSKVKVTQVDYFENLALLYPFITARPMISHKETLPAPSYWLSGWLHAALIGNPTPGTCQFGANTSNS